MSEKTFKPPWQPMSTAPKDKKLLLAFYHWPSQLRIEICRWMPGGFCIEGHPAIGDGWYFNHGSYNDKAEKPTAWMPLPDAPEEMP